MKEKFPYLLNIETNNTCLANCIICPRDSFIQPKGYIKPELFAKIIEDASNYEIDTIDLCGYGEPLLDKHFFEHCDFIKNLLPTTKIYMSSTLGRIKEWDIENICNYIDILKISLYGTDKTTYEKVHRGKLTYDSTIQNFSKLFSEIEIRKLLKKKIPHLIGLFVEVEENKHQTQQWIDLWEPILDEVIVASPHNWAGLKNYRTIDYGNQISCGRPFNTLYIHIDGKVSVCCWDINKVNPLIGDINNQTLEEIINSKELKFIQEKHKNNDFEGLLCKNCEQTNFNEDNLIYTSNKDRRIGKLTPTIKELV